MKLNFGTSTMVGYVFSIKVADCIIDGFVRRVWGKFGIDMVVMSSNGVIIVRYRHIDGQPKAMEVGPIIFDRKPVIMK